MQPRRASGFSFWTTHLAPAFSITKTSRQTFLAVDTLIRSISVWVPPLGPPQYNVSSLFITEAVGDTPEVDHLVYAGPPVSRPYTDPVQPTDKRVADLVGRMTLEEKAQSLFHNS